MAGGKDTDEPKVSLYDLGMGGVVLTSHRYQAPENALVKGQNAEVRFDIGDGGHGAVAKRSGFARLTPISFAGSVLGMFGTRGLLPAVAAPAALTNLSFPFATLTETLLRCNGTNVITDQDTRTATTVEPGASNSWDVLADDSDATYVQIAYNGTPPQNADAIKSFKLLPFLDPGVNTGHVLKARIWVNNIDHTFTTLVFRFAVNYDDNQDAHCALLAASISSVVGEIAQITVDVGSLTPETWTEVSVTISEAAVAAARSLGFYEKPWAVLYFANSQAEAVTLRVGRLWIEAPEAA